MFFEKLLELESFWQIQQRVLRNLINLNKHQKNLANINLSFLSYIYTYENYIMVFVLNYFKRRDGNAFLIRNLI